MGSAQPEDIEGFRAATGYAGALLVDPTLAAFRAAGLASGLLRSLRPRVLGLAWSAWRRGFRQGRVRGRPLQQGGTFVLGPGARLRLAWRDRHPGDHVPLTDVLAALPG